MASKKPKKENSFADLVARLNAMSNMTKEEERASLMEAARQEPRILDDKEVSLADIAKLAGIKEYQEEPKVSAKAEKLVESITKESSAESIITKAIKESDADESISTQIKKEVTEESKRLDKIAELEAQLAELKAQEKEEATLDSDAFKETFVNEITEYVKEAEADKLAELYNAFSSNTVEVKEDSFLIKTPETQEVIADAEKAEAPAEEEVVQEKEPEVDTEQATDEASGYQGSVEARKHEVTLAGDFTPEEPVTEKDAQSIEKMLQDAGIPAEVSPTDEKFDRVQVQTMADKDAILKVLGDMVEENMEVEYTDDLSEAKKKPVPTSPEKWSRAKAKARSKFDVYPSAYANAYAAKEYKKMGGGWRMGKPKKKK